MTSVVRGSVVHADGLSERLDALDDQRVRVIVRGLAVPVLFRSEHSELRPLPRESRRRAAMRVRWLCLYVLIPYGLLTVGLRFLSTHELPGQHVHRTLRWSPQPWNSRGHGHSSSAATPVTPPKALSRPPPPPPPDEATPPDAQAKRLPAVTAPETGFSSRATAEASAATGASAGRAPALTGAKDQEVGDSEATGGDADEVDGEGEDADVDALLSRDWEAGLVSAGSESPPPAPPPPSSSSYPESS